MASVFGLKAVQVRGQPSHLPYQCPSHDLLWRKDVEKKFLDESVAISVAILMLHFVREINLSFTIHNCGLTALAATE